MRKMPKVRPPSALNGFSSPKKPGSGIPVALMARACRTASMRTKTHQNGMSIPNGPVWARSAIAMSRTRIAKKTMPRL